MSEHYCTYKDGMCELDIDEAYQQGKANGAREFAEWLLVNHTMECIECNHGDKAIGCKECANDYLAEWQKGAEE